MNLDDVPEVTPEFLEAVRSEMEEARSRLEQSIINYRFGMIMLDGSDKISDELFIASMAVMLRKVFDKRRPKELQLPIMFAMLLVNEMRRNDK